MRPKPTKLSGSLSGSSFPTQTVGADRIRPKPDGTEPFVEWQQLPRPYKAYAFIRVLAEIRDYGRILSAPTRRIRSSGCFLKSGVSGGW